MEMVDGHEAPTPTNAQEQLPASDPGEGHSDDCAPPSTNATDAPDTRSSEGADNNDNDELRKDDNKSPYLPPQTETRDSPTSNTSPTVPDVPSIDAHNDASRDTVPQDPELDQGETTHEPPQPNLDDDSCQPSDLSMPHQTPEDPPSANMALNELSHPSYNGNQEIDLSINSQARNLTQSPVPEDLHQRLLEDQQHLESEDLPPHENHIHHQYQQQCLDQYQQHLLKLAQSQLPDMRDPHRLHEFEDPPHPHMMGDHRHLNDGVPPHGNRQHDGYWDMHHGMISSKIKAEDKEWYGESEDLLANSLSGRMKPEDHYANFRSQPGPEGMNGPRPNSLPQSGIPFSQSDQHFQPYPNLPPMRDMSPISPGYPGHRTVPGSHHHNASQHFVQQPQHMQHQHMQYGGQQFGNQQMGLQSHQQQIPSPYHQALGSHLGVHDGRDGRDRSGDPYSFVDEYSGPPPRPVDEILGQQPKRRGRKPKHIKLMENGGDPMAIAAAQAAHEAKKRKWRQIGPDGKLLPMISRPRKRIDRFDGLSEDELSKKTLPDHLSHNLDIVIVSKFPFQIGINPGLFAAYKGHHYAGPGNHFLIKDICSLGKCLYLSGLIPEPLSSDDDSQLLEHGIGFTNIVSRTTRGSAELTRKEIKEGGQILLAKQQRYQPRVAVFNGKGIYEIFSGKKEFTFGRQPEKIEGTNTHVWVMPSSSARCAQLPRALDKVPFYTALRKFRDFLKGTLAELTEEEVTFTTKKHLKIDSEKLEPLLPEMPEGFLDDQLNETCDSELDSDEISRSISQSLFNLTGITREQLENMDCPTIPIRKKRGRPKKTPEDPNAPPKPRNRPIPTDLLMCNGEDPPRKKRGRPKKVLEDGTIPPPKRPGRKPKALKEMLAAQQIGQSPQMNMNHMNGMLPPSGYNSSSSGPFSPYSSSMLGPHSNVPPVNSHSVNMSNHGGPLPSMHSNLQPPLCTTPNSNGPTPGPMTPIMPQRVSSPPVYSPGMSQPYSQSDKGDLQVDDHDLGLSPPPVSSPVMAQPDFEPPTSLPEGEGVINDLSTRSINNRQESIMERQQHTPSLQQFSNPGTPAEENFQNYQSYNAKSSCSPNYNTNVEPSPSYQPNVSHSPSYPASVSCSPSYTTHTHSPCHTNLAHSPSYPPNATNSPSFPNVSRSPSYQTSTHSPTYQTAASQSPSSYHPVSQSPSCTSIARSPSYPSNISQSPSYPPNATQSPSYRPQMPQSPSYPTHSPLNKPLPLVVHSPQVKGDVSSKSISGLESLVDQIPSLSEGGGGENNPHPSSGAGPFSPNSYQNFNSGNYPSHYNSPQSHPYSPHYSSSSTNISTNFSVSALASSSITTSHSSGFESENTTTTSNNSTTTNITSNSNSFSVSSLTGDSPSSTPSMYNSNSFSPVGPSHNYPDIMNPSLLPPTPPMGNFMGSSLMSTPSPVPTNPSPMSGSQLPYPSYPQYPGESSNYTGPSHSFPYSPTGPGFFSPRIPYPSPYSSGPYSQGYSQSSVLERIKQTGFPSF